MSTPKLVEDFYKRIWNDGNLDAATELLTPEFSFRGSLGNEMRGREAFKNYPCFSPMQGPERAWGQTSGSSS
jgi:hypothetical protein